jgi:hypothetical protein
MCVTFNDTGVAEEDITCYKECRLVEGKIMSRYKPFSRAVIGQCRTGTALGEGSDLEYKVGEIRDQWPFACKEKPSQHYDGYTWLECLIKKGTRYMVGWDDTEDREAIVPESMLIIRRLTKEED